MKKISSDKSTYYLKFILPFLILGGITIVTITSIYYKNYLVLIVPVYWLIASIITGKFTYYYRISEVFIDYERNSFYSKNRKNEYTFPFSDLKKVRSSGFGSIIVLKFVNKRKVLFAPPSDNLFGLGNLSLVKELKALLVNEKQFQKDVLS